MEKKSLRLKAYWFFSIRACPTGCLFLGLNLVAFNIVSPDVWSRFLVYSTYVYVCYLLIACGLDFLIARRVGHIEANPPLFFQFFWAIVFFLELVLLLILFLVK